MNTAPGFNSYQWLLNGNPFSTSSSITITQPGSYSIIVADSLGCNDSDSILINVNALPLVQAVNDTSACDGNSVTLSVTGASTYLWTPSTYLSSDVFQILSARQYQLLLIQLQEQIKTDVQHPTR